jgi:(S)-ureidoglycine aminohydrolase
MRKIIFNNGIFVSLWIFLLHDPILSGVYEWSEPASRIDKNLRSSVLFEGSTEHMEWLQMNAEEIRPSTKKIKITAPENEEYLYIIKKGPLNVSMNDSSASLVAGSMILLQPGKNLFIQTSSKNPCEYYLMKYRSRGPLDKERFEKTGGSFMKDWSRIEFKPHDKGGVRNYFETATVMCKRLEMHVTTLNGGLKSHEPHRHSAEEIILMINGKTEMQIGENFFKGKDGSVFFVNSNVLHGIRNEGTIPCMYFAFQFE